MYERATGYAHRAVKIMSVSDGGGMGSHIEQTPYTEHYPPDAASAKLWMQLVEGFNEKKETRHSGEVGLALTFNYVAPPAPDTPAVDAGH